MRIIGGTFKGRGLPTLESAGCRPAMAVVREALFNMLAARGAGLSGARVLDVFAGTGSLGFEALSRGAGFVHFVEANKSLARRIAENARALGLGPAMFSAAPGNALELLARPPLRPFDVVFVDPPYGRNLLQPVLTLITNRHWLAPDALLAAEVEKPLAVTGWPACLELSADRLFGQTRILLWNNRQDAPPSIPEPSIP